MEKVTKGFGKRSVGELLLDYALYIILFLILATVVIIRPDFFRIDNVINIIKQASTKGILALGCAGLIVLAGTDLSIGRVMGFSAAVTAAEKPITRPIDRSVPASTISPAQPSARMPLVEACFRMFRILPRARKCGLMMLTVTRIASRMIYIAYCSRNSMVR